DTVNLKNIVEHLSPKGFSTGVISTSSIVHATPASFYAHSPSRNYYEYIASQLATSEIDFFAGGGIQFFAKRTDGENQLNNLLQAGFLVDTTTLDAFGELEAGNKYGFLLADDGMPKMSEGRGEFLLNATEMAIEHLSKDEDGFFLMVEGSQIDWAGHANDARWLISEVLDFDKVINAALDFAKKDGNTLVIVTADHETGGFSLSAAEVRRQAYYANIQPTFSTGHHSASLVPIFAYGPGAERFQGVYNNSEVYTRMLKALKK
ncbi:MAG: alkaline phosphatase, partial [Bacteroidota bacterium]